MRACLASFYFSVSLLSAFSPLALGAGLMAKGNLDAWEGNIGSVWRLEGDEIVAGKAGVRQPKNDFLATRRTYGDFELRLKYRRGKNNGGIQFRSARVPNHHEVSGYQADLAPGIDGSLYDESRRKRFLARPTPEVVKTLNLGEWNDYRVRAEGARIRLWINGIQTADYTEEDPLIAREGIIALQIHSGADEIRYKEVELEELGGAAAEAVPGWRPGEVIALVGGANLERTRFDPALQTAWMGLQKGLRPARVRNLAWEGDTAFEQSRDVNFPSLAQQLEQLQATCVLVQFGQMESLRGEEHLEEFAKAYEVFLEKIRHAGRRVVLLTPTPFEKPVLGTMRDLSGWNGVLGKYAERIRELGTRRGDQVIDLYGALSARREGGRLTENGIHLNREGQKRVAEEVFRQLGLGEIPEGKPAVEDAVRELERLWFDYWRPMNWAFLGGDRTSVAFSHDWKDAKKRIFPEEMQVFEGILKEAEQNIERALEGLAVNPIEPRSPVPQEPPTVKAQTPEEELATLDVHPDYAVNLFASEKDGVGKVVQIRWDEKGRLWALCIPDYPQVKPGARPRNRLVICEDTDGDGRADRSTVFADELEMPLGFELGQGGVYLATSSALWFLRDTKGIGRADARELVLGGFGTGDTHQTINSLSWGFGGELWFTQGHSIYSRVETPYGIEKHDRAGLWRYRTRTGRLDTFFPSSTAGANNWGVLTDDYGQVFHKEGAGNGGFYSVPGLTRGSLGLSASAMQLFVSRDVKTVGFDMVGTRHFPEELQGAVVIGGVYNNSLQIHSLVRDGSGFKTTQLPNIINTKNPAFRPCDIRMGPDGAIYFADWYNVIVGHYQASYRHPDRDLVHGRIWRVTRKDRPVVKAPRLEGLSPAQLLEHVDSPERWVRYQAKRLLQGADTGAAVAALDAWVPKLSANSEQTEFKRLQALSLYEAHETPRPELLHGLLRASDSRVRAYATRALSHWARGGAIPQALEWLRPEIQDGDWMVRLEAVVAASYLEEPGAVAVALGALDYPWSPYLEHALSKTVAALRPVWSKPLVDGQLVLQRDDHLLYLLKHGRKLGHDPEGVEVLRAQLDRIEKSYGDIGKWLATLAEIGTWKDQVFAFERGSEIPLVLDALIQARRRTGELAPAIAEQLRARIQDRRGELAERALRLAGAWKVEALWGELEGRATGRQAGVSPALRRAAIDGVAEFGGPMAAAVIEGILQTEQSASVVEAAHEALLKANPVEAARSALERVRQAKELGEVKAVLGGVMARTASHDALLKVLQEGQPLGKKTALLALRALNEMGVLEKKISAVLTQQAGVDGAKTPYTTATIRNLVRLTQTGGDPIRGRMVFEQTGCLACHAVNEVGGKIGPALTAISRGLPMDMIVTEVLWPGVNVKEGYEAATVTLKDGTVVRGFKQTETDSAVSVRDMNTGEIRSLRRSDAASIQMGGTVMPDGLTAALTEKQLADLMAYLGTLGQ
jgi:putative heme-binding domain-containing protein